MPRPQRWSIAGEETEVIPGDIVDEVGDERPERGTELKGVTRAVHQRSVFLVLLTLGTRPYGRDYGRDAVKGGRR